MAWSVTAEPQRFQPAVDWFAARFPVTPEIADTLAEFAGPRAWTIAGVSQLEVVMTVWQSLLSAIESGTPFDEWKKTVESTLTEAWGRRNSPRLQLIFRNATQQAYNAGRWRQMTEPEQRLLRPFVMFDGIADSRQSPICRECNRTIVTKDDPWLDTHSPPLHHACRSSLRSLSEREARRIGIQPLPPIVQASPGFGAKPTEHEWRPDPAKYPEPLFNEYERKREEVERNVKRRKVTPTPKKTKAA